MPSRTITYSGRVQGVGFRMTVRGLARDLGLCGWVRNNDDGTVTVRAQGPEDAIDTLRARLRESGVGRIDGEEEAPPADEEGFQSFEIVR